MAKDDLPAPLGQGAPIVAQYLVDQCRRTEAELKVPPHNHGRLARELADALPRSWKHFVTHGVTESNAADVAAHVRQLAKGA